MFTNDDTELGYVPREDAKKMAPLLDSGATVDATVKKLWTTPDEEHVIPIIVSILHHSGDAPGPVVAAEAPTGHQPAAELGTREPNTRSGCFGPLLVLVVVLTAVEVGYLADVSEGDAEPTDPVDAVRGLVVGR